MQSYLQGSGLNRVSSSSLMTEKMTEAVTDKNLNCAGKHWIQYVSHQPASRIDVARLREMLDQKLMERQARESGICPVREELFSQCFDEIIRQVTLNLPERGLLLLRVRDEIMMTIAAYQTLYQR